MRDNEKESRGTVKHEQEEVEDDKDIKISGFGYQTRRSPPSRSRLRKSASHDAPTEGSNETHGLQQWQFTVRLT